MIALAEHRPMWRKIAKPLLLFGLFLHCAIAGATQIDLKDASLDDASLRAFKQQLQQACVQRSAALLRPLLADTVFDGPDMCGYSGCAPEEFLKYHFQGNEDWEQLENVLKFGFRKLSAVGDEFGIDNTAQFVQGPTYEGQYDFDQQLFAVQHRVAIKRQPDAHAKTIEKVSCTLLQKGGELVTDCQGCIPHREHYEYEVGGVQWLKVLSTRGELGYIPLDATSDRFHRLIRLCKIQGEWKIYFWFHHRQT